MDLGVMIAGAGVVAGVALYVIRSEMRGDVMRLDGRINSHEQACEERQKRLDERHEAISHRLENIDRKLDTLMEKL